MPTIDEMLASIHQLHDAKEDIESLYPVFRLWWLKTHHSVGMTEDEIKGWYDFIYWLRNGDD